MAQSSLMRSIDKVNTQRPLTPCVVNKSDTTQYTIKEVFGAGSFGIVGLWLFGEIKTDNINRKAK